MSSEKGKIMEGFEKLLETAGENLEMILA